jgi:hypothetical protein
MKKNLFIFQIFSLLLMSSIAGAEQSPEKKQPTWLDRFEYSGELRQETAYRVGSPKKFSKIKQIGELDLKYNFNEHLKTKVGGRAFYDAVYDVTEQYPSNVENDLNEEFVLRDAYVDFSLEELSLRLGQQQIVWGEALGQFFADVVNPKDLREFLLPDFDYIRIPIWALDAQYHISPDLIIEGVVSPDQEVNEFALPGSDFAFFVPPPPPGFQQTLSPDDRPATDFEHWNGGGRIAYLVEGWDLAGFYYTSPDHTPALFKTVSADPVTGTSTLILNPRHERVHHFGATFSKGTEFSVFRGEFVYTHDRFFDAEDPTLNEGVIQDDQFSYVLGFDHNFGKFDLNSEFQQQAILASSDKVANDTLKSWIFLRLKTGFMDEKLIPRLIFIVGLDEGDTQVSPQVSYSITETIVMTLGADIFSGSEQGLYGQFNKQDRIFLYTSLYF